MIPGRKIPPKGKKNQDEKIKMYEKNPLKCCQRIFSSRDSSDLLSRIDIKDFFKRQRCMPKTYCHKILAYGSDYMRKILCGINVAYHRGVLQTHEVLPQRKIQKKIIYFKKKFSKRS